MWRYDKQLDRNLKQITSWIYALGEPFDAEWRRYLKRLSARAVGGDVFKGLTSPLAFPSIPLLWWTAETADFQDTEVLEDLSYGALAGYFAIRIQDDVLDGHSPTPPLLLANILWEEYHRVLRKHLGTSHVFWTLWEDWYQRFCSTTLWEIRMHRGVRRPFTSTDLDRLGEKFLPAAGPATAVAFLADRPELVRWIPEIVMQLGCGLQLINDHRGIEHDFATGNYTAVLTDIFIDTPRLRPLEEARFPDSLRKTNALERNLERAKRYLELAARSAKAAAFAGVEAYAEELTQYADAELEKLRQGNPGRDADAPFRTAEG